MDFDFLIIQGIGFFAWLVLLGSYYRENTDKILIFHTVATILYSLYYYLLGAYSGLVICLFEAIRDYLYYKTDLDDYIFYGSVPIFIFNGIVNFTGWYDLLPIFAGLLDGYSLTKKRDRVVVGAIVTYTAWAVYNFCVMAYSCAITDILIVISNLLILLFDFNPFEFKKKGKQPCQFKIRDF